MSKVPEIKNNSRKKKIKSLVNDNNKISKSILNYKQKQSNNAEIKNFNIFEIENSFRGDEEIDENLEIFDKKECKKSGLPSISEILSTSDIDNLKNSILPNISRTKKSEKSKIQKYAQKTDIFTSKILSPIKKNTIQLLDISQSPLQDKTLNKNSPYSISRMFSDDLSDKENFGQVFTYISSSDDSQPDSRPPLVNSRMKKNISSPQVEKKCNTRGRSGEEIVEISRPKIHYESSNRRSKDPLWSNLERDKRITKILEYNKTGEDLLEAKKKLTKEKSFSLIPMKDFSCNLLPTESKMSMSSGIISLENNSVPKLQEVGIEIANENEESCTVCENAEKFLPLDIIDIEKYKRDVIWDDIDSDSVEIALTQCNLDYSSNKEDILFGSIEMMDKTAEWLMNENNLGNENGTDLISDERFVRYESTRMSSKDDEHEELRDITSEADIKSQNSIDFLEMINLRTQLSGQSNISSELYVPEFNLFENSEKSVEDKNLIYQNGSSNFSISQAMYIKQRSSFFKRQNNDENENRICFKLCNSTTEEVEEFLPDDQLHGKNLNNNASLDRKHNNNNEIKNMGQISNIQNKYPSFMDLRKESPDCNEQISAASSSMSNCLKHRYPFDENSELFNKENEDIGKSTGSKNRNISIDQISCSTCDSESIILEKNETLYPSNKRSFRSVSHRVQSFVEEWLNKNDELRFEASEKYVDKEKIPLKRRRLDLGREETERRINIEPEMLLSNYSSEYDKAYMIERFKRNSN